MDEHEGQKWLELFLRGFLVALIVWIFAAAILGIPHGVGHSIGSLDPVQAVHDIALPVWVGSLAGPLGLLIVRAFRSLTPRA